MILVDSSVWIDYFNGKDSWQTDRLDSLLKVELIITGDIILAEVLQGFRLRRDFLQAKAALTIFPCFNLCGSRIALASAENYRLLRQKGITVRKTVDMIIGTFCIKNGHLLLHDDRDFHPIEQHLGLKVISKR